MSNKDERNINIMLKNEEKEKDEIVISFSAIFAKLKKYFLPWIIIAALLGLSIMGVSAFTAHSAKPTLQALVSFSFDGIESGKAPDGNVFDVGSIKKPSVIEAALTKLEMPLNDIESIRQGISFDGIRPADAIDRITAYKTIFEGDSNSVLSAADKILDYSYYPTQFTVSFDYTKTGYSGDKAAQVLNTILDCYRDYFFETYGYNEALGSAVSAVDYKEYDYAEAIDIYNDNLTSLRRYVSQLSNDDTTRFRSSVTGYTFADLTESIKTVQAIDLDVISSYITVNNVTKDKDALLNYYKYRIQNLQRSETIYKEELQTITELIDTYEKDSILIIGNGTDDINTNYSQASAEYDNLLEKKLTARNNLSTTTQQIKFYNERITALNTSSSGSTVELERVENDLASLNTKVADLIELVNATAEDYYENVSYANAYSVLVPASSSVTNSIKSVINASMLPLLGSEALLFVVYIGLAFVTGIISENKKRKAAAAADENGESEENSDDSKE